MSLITSWHLPLDIYSSTCSSPHVWLYIYISTVTSLHRHLHFDVYSCISTFTSQRLHLGIYLSTFTSQDLRLRLYINMSTNHIYISTLTSRYLHHFITSIHTYMTQRPPLVPTLKLTQSQAPSPPQCPLFSVSLSILKMFITSHACK